MAAVLGLLLQPDDEVLGDLPEHEKAADPLRYAKILKTCSLPGGGFREFIGEVVEIEVGSITGDRLYRIRYSDGDLQHFTAEEVKACMPPSRAPQERTTSDPVGVGLQRQATVPPSATAVHLGIAPAPVEEDAAAEAAPPATTVEMPVVEEEADPSAVMEDQEVTMVVEGEQEEFVEAVFAEEAGEVAEVDGEEEVGGIMVDTGGEDVAEEVGLDDLAVAAEEDLNLIVLEEEEEEETGEVYFEEAVAGEKADDADAVESELLEGYLGGEDFAEAEEPEPQPAQAAAARVLRTLGVQHDIAKVKGRATVKALAKASGRPPPAAAEVEIEVFDEDAT
uniref:Tudor domain-containing protein n=1 Tax=Alexandrium andersonii TaxID=327968 RepID=A0A7S2AGV8_9DINO